jgi:hypothetical protein
VSVFLFGLAFSCVFVALITDNANGFYTAKYQPKKAGTFSMQVTLFHYLSIFFLSLKVLLEAQGGLTSTYYFDQAMAVVGQVTEVN